VKVEPLSGWNCLRFEQSKQKLSNPLEQLLALYFSDSTPSRGFVDLNPETVSVQENAIF